jgi:hypothetical protein
MRHQGSNFKAFRSGSRGYPDCALHRPAVGRYFIVSAGNFRTRFWLVGAVCIAAASFVHATPSHAPHRADAAPRAYELTLAVAPDKTAMFDTKYRVPPAPAMHYAGVQYAGAITQVSTETHGAQRPQSNGQSMHTGSIRDDVARYNEERVSRQIARPPVESGRQQGGSTYRN